MIQTTYQKKIKELEAERVKLQRYSLCYVWLKVLTFVGMCIGWYAAHPDYTFLGVMIPVVLLIGYVACYVADSRCCARIKVLKKKIAVCTHELEAGAGDYSAFADGREYIDPKHSYSFDLDLFGESSLYQRMNRTVTQYGSDALARKLTVLSDSKEEIQRNQEAIRELAGWNDWRLDFLANESIKSTLGGLSQSIGKQKYEGVFVSTWLPYVSVTLTLACLLLGIIGLIPMNCFSGMFILQLMFASCTSRVQKEANKHISALHKEYKGYLNLLRIMEKADFRAEKLKALSHTLFGGKDDSKVAFQRLSSLLNLFDIRGSEVMYILLNGLLLFDVLIIKEFTQWKKRYLPFMDGWLAAIGEVDALVSLAGYAYNHPQNRYAEIVEAGTDDVIVEAVRVYHPFLSSGKAVPNDFVLRKNRVAIVTGANMAGKSTFLRTVGITYVLANTGAPVCADRFRCSIVSLFSSMRTTDNLSDNISYFHAELLRLKQLVNHLKQHPHTLVILDEILKGTNSKDKLNGSILFLDFVSRMNMSGIIATHDLELAQHYEVRKEKFSNYCFEIELSDEITYSYQIGEGIARNLNASYLLQKMLTTS